MTTPPSPAWLVEGKEGCVLTLHVQPGAKNAAIAGEHGDALKLRIDSPPIEGRANAALIAFLADRLGVAKSSLRLISGDNARRKRVCVQGLAAAEIRRRLK